MNDQQPTPKAAPQFFIEVDTYWQNSQSYFVGPFESREAAQSWYNADEWSSDDNVWTADSTCGGDIRTARRIYPAPLRTTAARQRGLRQYRAGDSYDTTISPHVKPQARALTHATRQEEYA